MLSNTESWQFYIELRDFWGEKCKILEDFSQFVKEKLELDRYYGKGIEKLCKLSVFDNVSGSFGSTLNSLQQSLKEISLNFLNHCDFIQEDLLGSIKNTMTLHEVSIKEIKKKTKNLINEREKLLKKHESTKNKYLKSTKEHEFFLNSIGKFLNSDTNSLENYLTAVTNLNIFNAVFKAEITQPLERFKESITEKFQTAKTICRQLVSSDANCIYSMKMHLDQLSKVVEQTCFEIEMKEVDTLINKLTQISNETVIVKTPRVELDFSVCDEELKKIVFSCWEGLKTTEAESKAFREKIESAEGKKNFIQLLNEKRKVAEFIVPDEGFESLGLMFSSTLDALLEVKNFPIARQCIILSQTFSNKSKTYVQELIINHPLWSQAGYWEDLVEESIFAEVHHSSEVVALEEDPKENDSRNKIVAVSTLVAYVDIMNSFHKDKFLISQVLDKCKQRFGLENEEIPINFIFNQE